MSASVAGDGGSVAAEMGGRCGAHGWPAASGTPPFPARAALLAVGGTEDVLQASDNAASQGGPGPRSGWDSAATNDARCSRASSRREQQRFAMPLQLAQLVERRNASRMRLERSPTSAPRSALVNSECLRCRMAIFNRRWHTLLSNGAPATRKKRRLPTDSRIRSVRRSSHGGRASVDVASQGGPRPGSRSDSVATNCAR